MSDSRIDFGHVLNILREDGIVLICTDLGWCLGCSILSETAIARIKRLNSQGSLLMTDNVGKIQQYVQQVPDIAWDMIEMSNDALRICYPGAKNLMLSAQNNDKSIEIMVTKNAGLCQFCARLKSPLFIAPLVSKGSKTIQNFDEIPNEIKEIVNFTFPKNTGFVFSKSKDKVIKFETGNVFKLL